MWLLMLEHQNTMPFCSDHQLLAASHVSEESWKWALRVLLESFPHVVNILLYLTPGCLWQGPPSVCTILFYYE